MKTSAMQSSRFKQLATPSLAFLAVLGMAVAGSHTALAQDYPSKPPRLIVPFPPGGGVDGVARVTASTLSKALGQQLLVDNRGGSGGVIGAEAAARATPDGYTLFFGTSASHAINPHLYKKLPYDPIKDFALISPIGATPYILAVHPSVQAKSVAELVALAAAQPGKLTYGSAGNGSTLHLTGELMKSMAKVNVVHIPYKGGAQIQTDLIGGQISMAFLPVAMALQSAKEGRMRNLGITSARRSSLAPDLPAIAETGVPGYESLGWYGLMSPAGLPQNLVTRLNQTMQGILKDKDAIQLYANLGVEPLEGNPRQFAEFVNRELEKWGRVVKASGASID
jgi:tripartite-type tricarboxylate transporter receptor subunit TctC